MSRVQRLLDKRIIRQVTPIFDTRALGYSSMLVAAKVDPEHPHRAAQVINEHPGVSHNYLRNHDFNLWFTIATEPDSELGLEGTLEVLAREAGAESVRQLPTLKLFKIRMDLEMEGDTQALASAVQASEPIELDPQPYDELDIAVIRALQGDMPVVSEPYAAAAAEPSASRRRPSSSICRACRSAGILRRVAAILYHRRAGFSANGMGVWQVPDEQILDIGRRMAAVRGISHCYQRPTYEDWPYSVFTMAHGRSKEECDAVLDAIAEQTGITSAPPSTPRPSSRRSACSTSPRTSRTGRAGTPEGRAAGLAAGPGLQEAARRLGRGGAPGGERLFCRPWPESALRRPTWRSIPAAAKLLSVHP